MVGLSTLFVSIITMMVAFSTTLLLAYHDRLNCVTMLTIIITSVPATLYIMLHYPLLGDIFCSTYHSRFLFKPSKHVQHTILGFCLSQVNPFYCIVLYLLCSKFSLLKVIERFIFNFPYIISQEDYNMIIYYVLKT
ncbi:hypothetical protein Pint_12182 [Pistacia integerrima]|uniref:Uncharacterized protein n=1 Tax=Pistacia integerrima TaxID=434235 RepID=A0ACC0XLJ4_9ROSI|nr:hypothetical protein Pint_12182 [Pistacia integerrima]